MSEVVLIGGTYINALSVYFSLSKIGWKGEVYFLKTKRTDFTLIDLIPSAKKLFLNNEIHNIVKILENLCSKHEKIYFIPTDERFHEIIPYLMEKHRKIVFWGLSHQNNRFIVDKFEFYKFIDNIGLGNFIPKYTDGFSNPIKKFGEKFVFRMRRSWSPEGVKLPGIKMIKNKKDFLLYKDYLLSEGYKEKDWCYQEILDINPTKNLSVIGWHDYKNRNNKRYMVTRKILSHPYIGGNGDLVEILLKGYPDYILNITENILDGLMYIGPFELEFVYDSRDKTYKVIELNPRVWMQHLLFEINTNFYITRKYVNYLTRDNKHQNKVKPYWLNMVYALLRLLKGNLLVYHILLFQRDRFISIPPFNMAVAYAFIRTLKGFKNGKQLS